jgi:hypothetical protein
VLPIVCFEPSYFPRSYVGPPATDFGDLEAFAALAARLGATGEFAAVLLGTAARLDRLAPDRLPAALISPVEWVERSDADPTLAVRHVSYHLTLAIRGDDADVRYCLLERLTSVAQNALERFDLGGTGFAELSRLGRGRYDLSFRDDESRVILAGEFGYLVPNRTSRLP